MISTVCPALLHALGLALLSIAFASIMRDDDTPFSWYFRTLKDFHPWIAKPLGDCHVCLCGQLCLWSTIKGFGWPTHFYPAIYLLTCIGAGITFSYFLNKLYRWTESL